MALGYLQNRLKRRVIVTMKNGVQFSLVPKGTSTNIDSDSLKSIPNGCVFVSKSSLSESTIKEEDEEEVEEEEEIE